MYPLTAIPLIMSSVAVPSIGQWLNRTFATFDYSAFEFFSRAHTPWLTKLAQYFTNLGDTPFVAPLLIFALFMCLWKNHRRWAMTLFFSIVVGTVITNIIIKPVVARPRPYVSLAGDSQFMQWYAEAGSLIESDKSFPSGHTTAAFEIGLALLLSIRSWKIKWIFPIYSVLIGMSRIYLCVHYCTDVLAGVIIGTFAALLGFWLMNSITEWSRTSDSPVAERFYNFGFGRYGGKDKTAKFESVPAETQLQNEPEKMTDETE